MKIKSALIAALLITGLMPITASYANVKPVVESFKFTPTDIDLATTNSKIEFELTISHPDGIEDLSTLLTLANSKGDNLATYLRRSDNPVNFKLPKVTFKGNLELPLNITTGVYNVIINEVYNNDLNGYRYSTGQITPGKLRELIGAESGILVRKNGELNLAYETFVGPTHDRALQVSYNDPTKYNSSNSPIFKVGEIYDPIKYYELRVPSLLLKVSTQSPNVCTSDEKVLKFVKEGNCSFTVYTSKTSNYVSKLNTQNINITAARTKPTLFVGSVMNQSAKNLPLKLPLTWVYGPAEGYVMPKSETPTVCLAAGLFVNVVSGGNCILTYQSDANSNYLQSDLYKISFEVVRDSQTMTFTTPATANISAKTLTLSATASGGGAITYQSTSTGICSVTGSTLNLLNSGNCAITATQAGTTTLAPISATVTVMITGSAAPTTKNINCVKGKKTKKVSGTNPKCPKGYKVKR